MSQGQRRRPVTRRSAEPRRIADEDFDLWPQFAFRCKVCGLPVDKATFPVHPTCEVPR